MPIWVLYRPNEDEELRNPLGIHGAVVWAATNPLGADNPSLAIDAANAAVKTLSGTGSVQNLDNVFDGFSGHRIANSQITGRLPVLIQGDVIGTLFMTRGRGV